MAIVLVGYRGSGKTTVGRLIAARSGLELVDTDQLVVEAAGIPIRELFSLHGEAHFRELEFDALQRALAIPHSVISTGGGIVMRRENRALIRAAGREVIYLRGDALTLHARITGDVNSQANRPNLTALGGGIGEIEHLLTIRDPLYREVADRVIEVAGRTPEDIAEEILRGCEGREHHG